MKVSIVSTLYGSERYIQKFHEKCLNACKDTGFGEIEFILVDDGSRDLSNTVARELVKNTNNVNLIELSRNYGHHPAILEGLHHADGDFVFLIDCDLEEDPHWFSEMFETLKRDKVDVVFAIQEQRRNEGKLYRILSLIFYKIFRVLTQIEQPNNIMTCRVMTKRYVKSILKYEEKELNIGGLFLHAGFKQTHLKLKKVNSSPTTYNVRKKISHFVNGITSFSSFPLYISFYLGILITFGVSIYAVILLIRALTIETDAAGYWSIILSIWGFSGILLLFQGIHGIYISKIFSEVKNRPRVLVSDRVGPKFSSVESHG